MVHKFERDGSDSENDKKIPVEREDQEDSGYYEIEEEDGGGG